MAGMETFTDGSTGKFPTSTNTLTRHFSGGGGGLVGVGGVVLLRVCFHVCSTLLFPLFSALKSHIFYTSVPHTQKKAREITEHFPPRGCPGEARGKYQA